MLGYAVAAAAWLAQHAIHRGRRPRARRARSPRATAARRSGIARRGTLGRVWLVTLAILLVGLLGEREDGLAARSARAGPRAPVHLAAALFERLLERPVRRESDERSTAR